MKKAAALLILLLVSCSKESLPSIDSPALSYTVQVFANEGGTVSADQAGNISATGGSYEENSNVTLAATANEDYIFVGWSNGSRENPISFTIEENISITAKFVNKQKLLTRFDQIVIGTGENGPRFITKWKEMKIFLEGSASNEFRDQLTLFVEELNTILDNDGNFLCSEVENRSSSNVHMYITEADTYKEEYPYYENISLEDYWGYAGWLFNNEGYIYSGNIFVNTEEVITLKAIRWTIRHELGHVLGLKHTEDFKSIMHPFFREGVNEEFSDLDKESLRYMHDERMLVFSDSEQSRTILAGILGINDNKSVVQKAFSVAQTNSVVPLANYVYACRK